MRSCPMQDGARIARKNNTNMKFNQQRIIRPSLALLLLVNY